MDEQEILNLETGEKEAEVLKPTKVKIVKVKIVSVGEKQNQKLVCEVKHPDREENIEISAVKYERNEKLQITGLWINLDEDKKIRKNSALAFFKNFVGVKTQQELVGKELETVEDERGYLVIKAY